MISHHFVGTGPCSERLRSAEPARLLALVTERVVDCGLGVVFEQAVPFDNGGLTLVWVLAESHLVLHLWPEDGYATVDLHVCDYQASNAQNARRLRQELAGLCFVPGSGHWREMAVDERPPTESSASCDSGVIEEQRKHDRASTPSGAT